MRSFVSIALALGLATTSVMAQNGVVKSLTLKNGANAVTLTPPAGLNQDVTFSFPSLTGGGTLVGADGSGNVQLGAGSYLQLTEPVSGGGTNYTRLVAGNQTNNYTLTLPIDAPVAGDVLTVSSVGGSNVALEWAAPSGGGGGGGTVYADSYGFFYHGATNGIDNVVAGGANVPVPSNIASSITRTNNTTIRFFNGGVYLINYSVAVTAGDGANIALVINGALEPASERPVTGTPSQASGSIILTLAANSTISIRNNSAIPMTLETLPRIATHVTITKLGDPIP